MHTHNVKDKGRQEKIISNALMGYQLLALVLIHEHTAWCSAHIRMLAPEIDILLCGMTSYRIPWVYMYLKFPELFCKFTLWNKFLFFRNITSLFHIMVKFLPTCMSNSTNTNKIFYIIDWITYDSEMDTHMFCKYIRELQECIIM